MSQRQCKIALSTFLSILLLIPISNAQDAYDQKHIEVSLRMIGHQVLLNANDSTSLVLPIIKSNDRYSIQFESEFEFNPEVLVATVDRVVKETKMTNGYILEVEKCETGEVVYSYEMDDSEKTNIIPCTTRKQPKSCYNLLFTLMSTKKGGLYVEKSQVNYSMLGIMFVIIIGVLLFFWKRSSRTKIDTNLIPLGEYHFDKRNTELVIEDQRIELTNKEADLLLLLHNAVNTTVEREVILNMVWGDEGDYVGRTLDVFISKLRKKLEADPNLKIVNTRGVGYKLVLDDRSISVK